MAMEQANLSRRQALAGIGLAGAAAAVPVAALAKAAKSDRRAWNAAVARLGAAEAEYSRTSAQVSAVHDAAEAICPRRDEFFSRYGLGRGWSRERNFRAARMSIVIERTPKGRMLTPEEAEEADADAYRIVDDFETWCARHDEAFRDYDAWEDRLDAVVDERSAAQDALLTTEAPDREALLFKIELLASMLEEAAVEDANRFGAVRTDARRLLVNRRA